MTTKGILGRKVGMTQVFTDKGELVPVTAIEVQPNTILQVKTPETDGYSAIQLGVFDKREVLSNKPEQGHAKKSSSTPKRYIREIRDAQGEFKAGDQLTVDTFTAGEFVDVTGVTKGHGFQGAIKRLGQSRGPMAHGSRYHRRPGSMGAIINRVFKGKLLPGRMGNNVRTVQNLLIVAIDLENNLLLIKGNVPGANKSFVTIKSTVKETAPLEINLGVVKQNNKEVEVKSDASETPETEAVATETAVQETVAPVETANEVAKEDSQANTEAKTDTQDSKETN
jgi:large subunit ribosomal protein L3